MKRIVIILLFTGYTAALYSQEDAVLNKVIHNIAEQLAVFPQEKIYLHTDKPYYINGEKIFFRAFLLDAFSNKQDTLSRYVYVELINPVDSVVQRVKIRRDSTALFYGAIPLPEDLPQGDYKIRAYTQYMQNQGESSFFSKQVKISDPQILSIQLQTDFQFGENGNITTRLRFLDAKTQEALHPQLVTLRLNQEQPFTGKPGKDGWIRIQLKVPAEALQRTVYMESETNRHVFRQYIPIPYPEGDFDVSFYPEGGHLIAGQLSNIAFKAINTHGATLNIEGEIIDSKGNTVAEFKTAHDGMGEFYINPLPDEHYQAVCLHSNRTLRFDLPAVQQNALALKATIRNDKVLISINKQDSDSYPELYLLIHSRGSIVHANAWDTAKNYITFDSAVFPSGINHILLLTKELQIISERLVFILNDDQGTASFQTQKDSYRKREQIQAGIQLKDGEQRPLKGNFSIAVTNDKEVITDTTSNILSDILLRSELRGHIENPEYYFQKGNKDAEQAADLLMKTHGWTRYAIPEVVQGKWAYPKIPHEMSQEISGTVKSGLDSKLAKNFKVSLMSLNYGFLDQAKTDKNGRYVFRNFEFPDGTKYIVQALNNKDKGKWRTELYINEDTFPGIHTAWTHAIIQEEKSNPVLMDYVTKADRQYTYENGMRMINLPEVQVRGEYKDKYKFKSPYYSEPDYSFSEEDIKKYGATDIRSLFYYAAGVYVVGKEIRIRDGKKSALFVIDGVPYSYGEETSSDILDFINIFDVAQIDILKDITKTNIYGGNGRNGVIAIYTKRGEPTNPLPLDNIKPVTPLGYQLPVEFYSPKYDTQEKIDNSKPDLRTTIYWQPNVVTGNEGNAPLDFYTADDPGTYSVIIEGVSEEGKLIHYRSRAAISVK